MLSHLTRTYKTFTKEEVLKPLLKRKYKNLFELAASQPNSGIGAKFYRKSWPKGSYVTLTSIRFNDPRHGTAVGIKHWKGKPEREQLIRGPLKLGIWRYTNENNSK